MTRRRWIADKVEGDRAYLLDNNANHLFRVLRAQAGQQYDVVADGVARLGTITFASSNKVEFHLGEEVLSEALPEIEIYLSIFKFDHMEWAMEKLTELGVTRIVPMVAAPVMTICKYCVVSACQSARYVVSEKSRVILPSIASIVL